MKKWICPICGKENENAVICLQCGFDESRNYGRYPSVCQLPPNVKTTHEKRLSQRLSDNDSVNKKTDEPEPAPKTDDTPPEQEKDKEKTKPKSSSNYMKWLIATVCLIFVFVCGGLVLGTGVLQNKDPGSADPENMESESEQWRKNVLMSDGINDKMTCLGSDINRAEIVTITFLDTLDDVGVDAWDVSEKRDGSVMAWLKSGKGGYDLYIGAEGGLSANSESSGLFSGYENLRNINFKDCFHTDYVTSMPGMFSDCPNLLELDLRNFNTENVTDMMIMFYNCSSLTKLDLSSFNTENVTDMTFMFFQCSNLTDINLSSFDTKNVTSMGSMFDGCSSLKSLDLSNFNTKNVSNMSYMFCDCSSLMTINGLVIPEDANTEGMYDGTLLDAIEKLDQMISDQTIESTLCEDSIVMNNRKHALQAFYCRE